MRQGCLLSSYLFILCNNKNTSGVTIYGFELKNACYADDASFILDGSKKSFETQLKPGPLCMIFTNIKTDIIRLNLEKK